MKPELYYIWATPLSAVIAILALALTFSIVAYLLMRISPRLFSAVFAFGVVVVILWGCYNYYAIVTGMTPDEKAIRLYKSLAEKNRSVLIEKMEQTRHKLEMMERELDSAPAE